jgi:hypothetical protein
VSLHLQVPSQHKNDSRKSRPKRTRKKRSIICPSEDSEKRRGNRVKVYDYTAGNVGCDGWTYSTVTKRLRTTFADAFEGHDIMEIPGFLRFVLESVAIIPDDTFQTIVQVLADYNVRSKESYGQQSMEAGYFVD